MARLVLYLIGLAAVWPAVAQTAAAPAAAPACELHVWPSAGLAVTRARAGENFTWNAIDGEQAVSGYESSSPTAQWSSEYDDLKTEHHGPDARGPLTPARQIVLMQGLPLAAMLGLPGYRTVFHSETKTLGDVRKPARLIEGETACHAELILTDLTYARVYAHGHNLKTFWVLRDFGKGSDMKRRTGLALEDKLTVPTDETKRTDKAFFADLERAFIVTLEHFSKDVQQGSKQ